MISFRQADLLEMLHKNDTVNFQVSFLYEPNKVFLSSVSLMNNEDYDHGKKDLLEYAIEMTGRGMGFYKDTHNDRFTYNTNKPREAVVSLKEKLEKWDTDRIIGINHAIYQNTNATSFSFGVSVK